MRATTHRYKPVKGKPGQIRRVKPRSRRPGTSANMARRGFKVASAIGPKKSQRGTLFGSIRVFLMCLMGVGIVALVVARVLGYTGFAIGAGITVGGLAAGSATRTWWRRRQGKEPPKARRGNRMPKQGKKPYVPPPGAGPRRPPPRPNKNGPRPCSAACRRSPKPKSTCMCKAAPCFHGTES